MSNSYNRPSDPSQYGGGGSSGANYYDSNADFSIQPAPSNQSHHPGVDYNQAVQQAKYHHSGREDADDDEDSSFFSKAVGFLNDHKERFSKEDIDEEKVVGAHQQLYGDGRDDRKHDADSLGAGAAMQALKMFMSDSGKQDQQAHAPKGAADQNKLVGIAMAQAGKLWEQKNKNGQVTTDKQSAVNAAAGMALKMYLKGQGSGGGALGGLGGLAGRLGGQSGGSDLFNIARKFL
ncbi:hypothetical protein FQN57_003502 [Myotisia sp. PD_48]|nr:hypothetical protein FQN57_003502 [Myotisia sp. PD_48]